MTELLEIIVKLTDDASAGFKAISEAGGSAATSLASKWKEITVAGAAAGASLELMARQQAPLTESTRKLAETYGMSEEAMRSYAISVAGSSDSVGEMIEVMMKGRQAGIDSADGLKTYTQFWDMVGDATHENTASLAEAGMALRTVGITAGHESEALGAFGFVTRNTTLSVGEFLNFLNRAGPNMTKLGLDVNDAAAALGVFAERGIKGRPAIAQFNKAMSEAISTGKPLAECLGVTAEKFDALKVKVDESSGSMAENAAMHDSLITPMEKLQNVLGEVTYKFAGAISSAAQFAPALLAIGPALKGFDMMRGLAGTLAVDFSRLSLVMSGTASAVPGLTTGITGMIPGFAGASAGATAMGSAIWLALLPLLPIIAAVAAAVILLYAAWTVNLGGIQEKVGSVSKAMTTAFTALTDVMKQVVESAGGVWESFLTGMDSLDEVGTKTAGAAKEVDGFTKSMERAGAQSQAIGAGLELMVAYLGRMAETRVAEFFKLIGDRIKEAGDIVNFFTSRLGVLKPLLDGVAAAVKPVSDAFANLKFPDIGKLADIPSLEKATLIMKSYAASIAEGGTNAEIVARAQASLKGAFDPTTGAITAQGQALKDLGDAGAGSAELTEAEEARKTAAYEKTIETLKGYSPAYADMKIAIEGNEAALDAFQAAHDKLEEAKNKVDALKSSYDELNGVIDEFRGLEDDMETSTLKLSIAQDKAADAVIAYNTAVQKFGATSREARTAQLAMIEAQQSYDNTLHKSTQTSEKYAIALEKLTGLAEKYGISTDQSNDKIIAALELQRGAMNETEVALLDSLQKQTQATDANAANVVTKTGTVKTAYKETGAAAGTLATETGAAMTTAGSSVTGLAGTVQQAATLIEGIWGGLARLINTPLTPTLNGNRVVYDENGREINPNSVPNANWQTLVPSTAAAGGKRDPVTGWTPEQMETFRTTGVKPDVLPPKPTDLIKPSGPPIGKVNNQDVFINSAGVEVYANGVPTGSVNAGTTAQYTSPTETGTRGGGTGGYTPSPESTAYLATQGMVNDPGGNSWNSSAASGGVGGIAITLANGQKAMVDLTTATKLLGEGAHISGDALVKYNAAMKATAKVVTDSGADQIKTTTRTADHIAAGQSAADRVALGQQKTADNSQIQQQVATGQKALGITTLNGQQQITYVDNAGKTITTSYRDTTTSGVGSATGLKTGTVGAFGVMAKDGVTIINQFTGQVIGSLKEMAAQAAAATASAGAGGGGGLGSGGSYGGSGGSPFGGSSGGGVTRGDTTSGQFGVSNNPYGIGTFQYFNYISQNSNGAGYTQSAAGQAAYAAADAQAASRWANSMCGGGGAGGSPFAADGGTVVTPGTVVVGEAGPELLTLPTGATITPLTGQGVLTGTVPDHHAIGPGGENPFTNGFEDSVEETNDAIVESYDRTGVDITDTVVDTNRVVVSSYDVTGAKVIAEVRQQTTAEIAAQKVASATVTGIVGDGNTAVIASYDVMATDTQKIVDELHDGTTQSFSDMAAEIQDVINDIVVPPAPIPPIPPTPTPSNGGSGGGGGGGGYGGGRGTPGDYSLQNYLGGGGGGGSFANTPGYGGSVSVPSIPQSQAFRDTFNNGARASSSSSFTSSFTPSSFSTAYTPSSFTTAYRAFAEGGEVTDDEVVIVGENGPEMLNLPGGAKVTPLSGKGPVIDYEKLSDAVARGVGKGGAKGGDVHIHVAGVWDKSTLKTLARMLKQIDITENIRTGRSSS